MVKLQEEGLCKTVGVSNFVEHHLVQLIEDTGHVPAINQIEFSPFQYPESLLEYCKKQGILVMGYSPLGKEDC
eukprot:TRINITY_DN5176_c0_g1_i1.p1 TRINITY_DN5176_c0_g1~~TRINITY_DN5176_c0_g1_i1.p1  ORF type:complete len:73 (+),score=8.11 TRINITY_DN5176_c0_g1_i1:112-330(+)